jgi:hypothetical protein
VVKSGGYGEQNAVFQLVSFDPSNTSVSTSIQVSRLRRFINVESAAVTEFVTVDLRLEVEKNKVL